jgi:hypothetical protein
MSVEDRLSALEARVAALEDQPIVDLAKHEPGKADAIRRLGMRVADFEKDYLFYVTPRTEIPTVRCVVCGAECAAARLPEGLAHAAGCRLAVGASR